MRQGLSAYKIVLVILIMSFASVASAELKIESVYPTLGQIGQNLDVTLTGTGFNENTRISMYLDADNHRVLVGSVATSDYANGVCVSGSYAYVADGLAGLQVIDISNPSSPAIIGSVDTQGYANGVYISGSFAYVADGDTGLQVIDIINPLSPAIIGSVDTPGDALNVYISGDYAYVADWDKGLQVIDISEPSKPIIIGSVAWPGHAYGVYVSGSYAYVADPDSGLQVIDISEPSNPAIIESVASTGYAYGVHVSGDYAYVANVESDLQVIDISNPSNPTIVASVATSGFTYSVYVSGSHVYVPYWGGGLQVIDITSPSSPDIIGSVATPGDANGVYITGSYAFVADGDSGLQVIDISNLSSLAVVGSVNTPGDAYDVYVSGNYAYVADPDNGLQVIDISNPLIPTIVGSVATPGLAYNVYVSGNFAYVADGDSGLQVIDISSPSSPAIIGSVDTLDTAYYSVYVSDSYAYVTDWFGSLQVIDISSPSSPAIIGSVATPGEAYDVYVSGNFAYVADGDTGLQVIDISSPSSPAIIGSVDTPDTAYSIYVSGSYAYVADWFSGLQIVDISDPSSPAIISAVDIPVIAYGVYVSGNYAYVADCFRGLHVIDISNPSSPAVVGSVGTPGYAISVYVSDSYAYVADFYGGFVILPLPVEATAVTINSDTNISVTLPSPLLAGIYTLRVFNETEHSELVGAVSFTNDPNTLKSKAIIVAGGGPDASGGTIWEETKMSANKAYDALILQGYQHDSIYYMSEETLNEYVDSNNPDTFLSDLSNAINVWASDASQLLIYLVDHGQEGEFVLHADSSTTVTLNVADLDSWLDSLQETMTGPVTIIYDACQSGSFVSKMRPPDGKERIIITSSSYEPAYFLENGRGSFSFQFWDKAILNRGNLGEAFSYARDSMQSYQSSRIEANWDLEGNTNEGEDLNIAEDMTIQRGGYAYIGVHPFITSVSAPQIISSGTSATIRASGVIDSEGVYATIIPPDIDPETSGVPITDLSTIELTDPDGDHTYEGVHDYFDIEGTYVVVIKAKSANELYSYVSKAMTIQNIYSPPMYTSVTNSSGIQNIEPDIYELDDTYDQASVIVISDDTPQVHNFHYAGDEDWVKFYGIPGEIYKVKAGNVSILGDPIIEVFDSDGATLLAGSINAAGKGENESLEWNCPEEGIYYVRITNANSDFGENVRYELNIYNPVAGIPGFLTGIVLNSLSEGIDDAVISSNLGNGTAITNDSGAYLMVLPSGTHTITIKALGYAPHSKSGVEVLANNFTNQDFIIFFDIDNDGVGDQTDNCPDIYNPDQADTDGDEIGDACDGCPADINKTEPGICGCGVADTDADGDGTVDCLDTDDDGMLDDWEINNNLNPNVNDSGDDPDGDKFTNGREYQDQTDPNDNASHLILPAVTGRIPDTGQTTCYNSNGNIIDPCPQSGESFYGQDGNYIINPPSYIKMDAQGNYLPDSAISWAMVWDNVTGLIWENKTNDGSIHDVLRTFTWCNTNTETNCGNQGICGTETGDAATDTEAFIEALNDAKFGGFSDWRMPTSNELTSFMDRSLAGPSVNTEWFPYLDLQIWPYIYWVKNAGCYGLWTAWFCRGEVTSPGSTSSNGYFARAVRGGKTGESYYIDNKDGTVTDITTGLMWQQTPVSNKNWENAISYAESLTLAGYDDWRLPHVNELQSIIDYSRTNPSINTVVFPETESSGYRSSTTIAGYTYSSWNVYFTDGTVGHDDNKSNAFAVRVVRGGQHRSPGNLVIYSPTQASVWKIGSQKIIAWDTSDISGNVKISLSRQGGKTGTFTDVIVESVPNNGSYIWTVDVPETFNAMLKIEPLEPGYEDKGITQGLFTISSQLPPAATISGEPTSITNQTTASLTVGGTSIISYKYKLGDDTYSNEILVPENIELSGLVDGTYTVYVIGRDAAGDWQSTDSPTTVSWIVDTTPPSPPNVSGVSPTNDTTPTWTWTSGGGGSGIYRYKPDNSDLSIDATETTSMSYTPVSSLMEGSHTLYVQERDEAGNWSSAGSFSILIDNNSPTADAGSDQMVNEGVIITINALNSYDNETGIASYMWTQIAGPSVSLSDPTASSPTFMPPDVGITGAVLVFELTVTDNVGLQNIDTCTVNVSWVNVAPTASGGGDQIVDEGTTVTLDGTNSFDPDDSIATYLWTQVSGTVVTLSSATAVNATFTAPDVGLDGVTLTFQLTVTDNGGLQNTDTCNVNISFINIMPTANAGRDQTVDEAITVTLDGSNSSDPDAGDGIASYEWVQIYGSPVVLSDSTASKPTFTSPNVGPDGEALTFELTVTDNGGLQDTDTCIVNVSWVNIAPIANAGSDQTVDEGVTVTLDGSNSSDSDDGIANYEWVQTAGSSVILSDPSLDKPTFTSPNVGPEGEVLEFELTVTDNGGLQDTDTCIVNITWENNPPNANAGPDQNIEEGLAVTLNGSNSSDVDDGIAAYLWSQTAGIAVTLSNAMAVNPTFIAPNVEPDGVSLTFQLIVTDKGGLQDTDTCIFNVTGDNDPPVSDTGPDQIVGEGATVTLDGGNSYDADDGLATYEWTQISGSPVTLSDPTISTPTFTAPNVAAGGASLTFELTVTDNGGLQGTDTCIVNVTGDNDPPVSDAGPDQIVIEGDTVILDGSSSYDPDDGIHRYLWTQTSGTPVTLSDATAVQPTFVTPTVGSNGAQLNFLLSIIDNSGLQHTDIVSIIIEDNEIINFAEDVLPTDAATGKVIGFKVESGGAITSLYTILSSSISDTTNMPDDTMYGLIDLEAKCETVGGTVKVTVFLEDPAPDGYTWYKYTTIDGWINFNDYVEFNDDRTQVTLTLTDGGAGDDDGEANGVIVDPSGLGYILYTPPPMTLNAGWNMISLSHEPVTMDIELELVSIFDKVISVWAYQEGKWQVYDPDNPGFSDLTDMDAGKGYWINMAETGSLSVSGAMPSKSIALSTGWNLVGYNSDIVYTVGNALTSIVGKYISVWAYVDGKWQVYDPDNPGFSDLKDMIPSYGYWINAKEQCTWTLP